MMSMKRLALFVLVLLACIPPMKAKAANHPHHDRVVSGSFLFGPGVYGGWMNPGYGYDPYQFYVQPQVIVVKRQPAPAYYPLPQQQAEVLPGDNLPQSKMRSTEEVRLNRLKDFHDRGVITDEEFQTRRESILKGL